MENWKTIENFEAYEVSDLGRVRRRLPGMPSGYGRNSRGSAKVGHILSPTANWKGYLHVCLCKQGKMYSRRVHRLVAEAFIPNPNNLPQVNHKSIKTDNRACKLEWISTAGHGKDIAKQGQRGDGVTFSKQKGKWKAGYCPEPNKWKHIGYFNDYESAKRARDKKVKSL
jgi:hypothetical protein